MVYGILNAGHERLRGPLSRLLSAGFRSGIRALAGGQRFCLPLPLSRLLFHLCSVLELCQDDRS